MRQALAACHARGAARIARAAPSEPDLLAARAAARPDQGIGLARLVVEQVGEDRAGEAWIVELDREVVAAFVRPLGPGRADLGPPDINAMAGRLVAGPVGLRDNADTLGLNAQRDDLALVLVVDLLEGTDVGHVTSPCCSGPRPSRPRWRSAGRRRSPTHPPAGWSAAEDALGETFLPREEWAKPRGRKSRRGRCGSGDRGAAGLRPDSP